MGRADEFRQYMRNLNLWNRFVLKATMGLHPTIRSHFANRYLTGDGIEIGAQHLPLKVSNGRTRIKYVDRIPKEVNAVLYKMPLEMMVEPDYYLEAEDLNVFADQSLDFVIANHILEHMEDPIGALMEWFRVLKEGGVLFLAVPNYLANEYDFRRVPVSADHLVSTYNKAEPSARWEHKMRHWREFVTEVDDLPPDDPGFESRLQHYIDQDDRIHFHVFDFELLIRALDYVKDSLGVRIEILDAFHMRHGYDLLLIVRKRGAGQLDPEFWRLNRPLRNVAMLIKFASPVVLKAALRRIE